MASIRTSTFGLLAAALAVVPAASASVEYRSRTTASVSAWTSIDVDRPASLAAGDVLVALVAPRLNTGEAITPPAGWSVVRRVGTAPGDAHPLTQAAYVRIVRATEPSSYRFSFARKTA